MTTSAPRLDGGGPTPLIDRIIRVNHAGELGAVRLYEGQLAVLAGRPEARTVRRMLDQERRHLAAFEQLIPERRVRPTLLTPFWHAAGFALGAASALMGREAAMACTEAIEDVIDEHYAGQLESLEGDEEPLREMIAEFRADELAHREEARRHAVESAPGYRTMSAAVKAGSRLAIWLSERL